MIYLAEGNVSEAGMSVIGMVPLFGDAMTGAKLATGLSGTQLGETPVTQLPKAAKEGFKNVWNSLFRNCFTEGTQIVVGMEYDADSGFIQYVTVNIEDIKVGDLVYSYDTNTGEVSQKAVTATFSNTSDHINLLTIVDEQGNEQVIETTDGHPFWVVTNDPDMSRAARDYVFENDSWLYHEDVTPTEHGYWVEAKDLCVGDVFLGANGELSMLTNAVRVEQEGGIGIFNFTVEGNHNYFILAKEYEYGQSCVLVHNTTGPYCHLQDGPKVGPGKNFTAAQRKKILDANKTRNGGEMLEDTTGRVLVPSQQSKKGVTPPSNEAQVDHIIPKSLGGSNSYSNAQVLARDTNCLKSNKPPTIQKPE